MRESYERVFRSSYFDEDTGVDIHFSYSTCNSTADDWLETENTYKLEASVMGGKDILANIPSYRVPSKSEQIAPFPSLLLVSDT